MRRRRFDHLVLEISLALGLNLPRYPLWLSLKELGMDPEFLSRAAAIEFCDDKLEDFLARRGLRISPRKIRRIRRAVARFDPSLPTPYERMAQT